MLQHPHDSLITGNDAADVGPAAPPGGEGGNTGASNSYRSTGGIHTVLGGVEGWVGARAGCVRVGACIGTPLTCM